MQKHIKVYREFFKIGDQDVTLCEVCSTVCVDIHHITSRGLKTFKYEGKWHEDTNDIKNLIGLCRECHNKAHSNILTKEFLYKTHKIRILLWSK